MSEPTSYLDKPKRSYEGAVEHIRRRERERIAAKLRTLAQALHDDDITAWSALVVAADMIDRGAL